MCMFATNVVSKTSIVPFLVRLVMVHWLVLALGVLFITCWLLMSTVDHHMRCSQALIKQLVCILALMFAQLVYIFDRSSLPKIG